MDRGERLRRGCRLATLGRLFSFLQAARAAADGLALALGDTLGVSLLGGPLRASLAGMFRAGGCVGAPSGGAAAPARPRPGPVLGLSGRRWLGVAAASAASPEASAASPGSAAASATRLGRSLCRRRRPRPPRRSPQSLSRSQVCQPCLPFRFSSPVSPGSRCAQLALAGHGQCPGEIAPRATEPSRVVQFACRVGEPQTEQLPAQRVHLLGEFAVGHVAHFLGLHRSARL